ncbi:MAG: hypothetical protein NTU44_03600 [Bacteroidetes bacterium]|nr:hypothetical protein [Bacteroidota bacterium]
MVNLATAWSGDGSTQGQLIGQNVFIWLGANSWSPSSQYNVLGDVNAKCNAVPNETNLSQYDFWPKNVFPLPEIVIKELDFIFNNGSWNLTARDVAGFDFKIKPQTGSVSSGAFTPFPTKVTDLDLININYNPKLDTIGSGLPQGILTGSDRVFIYMEFETATGNLIPVAIGDLTKTSRLQMQNLADGTFEFHFILRNLFTENELPTGVEVKKIFFKFVNYDGLVSPFGNMDPKLYKIDKILKAD